MILCVSVWFILLLIYTLIVNSIVGPIVDHCQKEVPGKYGPKTFSSLLAYFEILTYALSWVLGYPAFIGIWLGVKVVKGKWTTDPTERAILNIYLFGNLLSLMSGVLGGLIFKWLSNTICISSFLTPLLSQ